MSESKSSKNNGDGREQKLGEPNSDLQNDKAGVAAVSAASSAAAAAANSVVAAESAVAAADAASSAGADSAVASENAKVAAATLKANVDHEGFVSAAELREYRRGRADGLVGLFTLIALLLGFGAYTWWKTFTPLMPPQRINVMFHDVASLNYQAAVYVDGVRVGSVDKIEIKDNERVQVGIKVNTRKITIPVGSRFIILPNGVVGAKYIEIVLPKRDPKTEQKLLTENMVVEGDDPIRPEIVVNELVEKLSTLDFTEVQTKLGRSLDKMGNVADEVGVLSKKMEPVAEHATQTADSVSALATEMRAPVNQMHQILDQKHPLLHMVFGRPGHIKEKKVEQTTKDSANGAVTTTTTSSDKEESSDDSKTKKKKHHFLGL
ncbi:MAG TPA: MlaD family protein [Oculatellaceae cyanobacterium]